MNTSVLDTTFLGKEVQIYPGDYAKKFGIVEAITEYGVIFKITESQTSVYPVGSTAFISFSANLIFVVRK